MVIWKVPQCLLVCIATFTEVLYASFKVENVDFYEVFFFFCVLQTVWHLARKYLDVLPVSVLIRVSDTILGLIHECSSVFLSSLIFVGCRKSNVLFPTDHCFVVGCIRVTELHCRYVDSTYYRLYFVAGACTLSSLCQLAPLSMFYNL
jgi:hypothetical protein